MRNVRYKKIIGGIFMGFSMEVTDEETIKKEIIEQVKPVSEEVLN